MQAETITLVFHHSLGSMDETLQGSSSRLAKQLQESGRVMWYVFRTKACSKPWLTYFEVFGPSTDYRDVRKAAYQEYLVTTDFNVARLPTSLSVNTGAAIGVAFVSALLSLGISLGFSFTNIRDAPRGPDLLDLFKGVNREDVPEDVRNEVFEGIKQEERPQAGDWFAIWGGKSCLK